MGTSVLQSKSFEFAVAVIQTARQLQQMEREFVVSKQLVRSGTAVGALLAEAVNAESKPDFIHKQHIALKEARESLYWLRLLQATGYLNAEAYQELHNTCEELVRMLTASIKTLKGIQTS